MELPPEDEIKLVAMLHTLCEAASRDGELLGYLKSDNEMKAESWDGVYALASLLLEYSLRNDIELAETARYSFIMLIQLAPRYPGLEKSLSQETGLGLTVRIHIIQIVESNSNCKLIFGFRIWYGNEFHWYILL